MKNWKLQKEIESANEELTTTNQELKHELTFLMKPMIILEPLFLLHETMLVLGKNLRIKSANKAFYQKFESSRRGNGLEYFYMIG
ncbi:MAG: hypothetical protein IPO72_11715 [Saprospiraceae bacterium]|nr:hypothetical protein [Candidatus Vicinibacter affinis]